MCGISGLISAQPLTDRDVGTVLAMTGALHHRGPDGQGQFKSADGRVMTAMRRLAIIDLMGGWQPLYNEDKSIALVANGEVYNYVELRAELAALGHTFHTKSDCEMIAHAYEQWGMEFVHKLRGMYAFAMHDARKNRVIIGRDRVGEKPLYLLERGEQVLFASELKSLLASGRADFELDPVAVHEYLHYGWIPEPRSPVLNTRKLPPGSLLVIDLEPWSVREVRYWRMDDAPAIDADPVKAVRAQLDTISELIIRSEVPVGVALSGGVDSSAIAALAVSKYPGTMHAFSVGFKGRPPQDERHLAKQLADHLKMPMHEIEVDIGDMAELFPTVCFMRDDPIVDSAGVGYYLLSKASRDNGCPVLLQGQGGDELFWGYPWAVRAVAESEHKAAHGAPSRSGLGDMLPKGLSRPELVASAFKFGGVMHGWGRVWPDRSAPADRLVCYDLNTSYQMGEFATPRMLTPEFVRKLGDRNGGEFFTFKQPWGRVDVLITRLQIEGYLLENGIAQGDRLSMASSVELRLPLVDYRLIETVIGLRKAHPDHHLPAKSWFKEAIKDIVPSFVFNRPKRGFNLPGTVSINAVRNRWGRDLLDGYLVANGVIRPEAAAMLGREHSRLAAWNDMYGKVAVLESWARQMAAVVSRARAGQPDRIVVGASAA
ncbi:MAG: asparagine synthase (glutamine-hydrolyzing) [Phycisphaerales bacterium]